MNTRVYKQLKDLSYVPDEIELQQAFKRVSHLAIGAHQDDLEIFAYHGIAECYDDDEQWFAGVTVTDGGGSARTGTYADFSDEEMRAERHREQNQAAAIGKYSFQSQLELPSKLVKNEGVASLWIQPLADLLKSCRPHTLYLHNPADKHLTHLAVLKICIEALRSLAPDELPERIYGCEVWRGLDWIRDEDKIALPVDKHPELERRLLDVFKSQIAGGKNYTEASIGRRRANATYYSSHATDTSSALTFAVDLHPLLTRDELKPEHWVQQQLDKLREDTHSAYHALKAKPTSPCAPC